MCDTLGRGPNVSHRPVPVSPAQPGQQQPALWGRLQSWPPEVGVTAHLTFLQPAWGLSTCTSEAVDVSCPNTVEGPVQKGALLSFQRKDHQAPTVCQPLGQALGHRGKGTTHCLCSQSFPGGGGGRTSKQPTTNHYKLGYVL